MCSKYFSEICIAFSYKSKNTVSMKKKNLDEFCGVHKCFNVFILDHYVNSKTSDAYLCKQT